MIHEEKTHPKYFARLFFGDKTFEVRKNDRDYRTGDFLQLNEYDPEKDEYTGRSITKVVGYVLEGGQFGIEAGYVVMAIHPVHTKPTNRLKY